MKDNIDFLNDLYQNSEMGIVGIDDVLFKIKNHDLKSEIQEEKREYQRISNIIKKLIKKYNGELKSVNIIAKVSSNLYSEVELMMDNSDERILKMMIEGSYKSIGIITTKILQYSRCDNDVIKVAKQFEKTLNKNVKNLKSISKKYFE